jgi:hypothetical protein
MHPPFKGQGLYSRQTMHAMQMISRCGGRSAAQSAACTNGSTDDQQKKTAPRAPDAHLRCMQAARTLLQVRFACTNQHSWLLTYGTAAYAFLAALQDHTMQHISYAAAAGAALDQVGAALQHTLQVLLLVIQRAALQRTMQDIMLRVQLPIKLVQHCSTPCRSRSWLSRAQHCIDSSCPPNRIQPLRKSFLNP